MILENFINFIRYFGKGKKLKLSFFSVMSLIAGGLEFAGITLIYPFILMIIKPEALTQTIFYAKFTNITHISNPIGNALLLGFLALILFVLKNVYMILFLRLQSVFIVNWRQDIANSFMEYFLFGSYKNAIKTSNSDKYYIINNLCNNVMSTFIIRCLTLFTNTMIVIMVIGLIMIKFPIAGLATIIFSIFSMLFQNKYMKKKTSAVNKKITQESKIINELTYANIENTKEIKINGLEEKFGAQYINQAKKIVTLVIESEFLSGIPPYIVEIFIVLSLIILGGIIACSNIYNHSAMVASFALVAAAIFRIAPALNRIQTSIININMGRSYVKALIEFYEQFDLENFSPIKNKKYEPMSFNKSIAFKNIYFSYIEGKPVLKNITFEINKGDFVGIIGLSGSGKTTLADVLMGLLPPDSGEITIDGIKLTEKNYHNFRKIIGYVPQEITITEKSFKENIAWGEEPDDINEEQIRHAIDGARLDTYVNEFADGINATPFIGTNGASQGQKQRIALARVLYRNPEILILDEATSSLDVKIEHEITDMLNNLKSKKTIIAIAHRLSTLKTCNKLIYIKDGKLVDIGTFSELSARYEDFANLLKLSSIN